MADDTTDTTAPPSAAGMDPALLQRLLGQLTAAPPPAPPQPAASSHEGRGFLSLLGEALGGGQTYGSTAEREQGGLSAAQAMGLRMMAASDYSYQPHTLGSIVAQGALGARESLGQTQAVSAARAAAAYEQQRQGQQDQLARLKEAIPLLTTQARLAAAGQLQNPLVSGNVKPGTSIAGAGDQLTPFVAPNLPAGVSAAEDQMVRTVIGEAGNQDTTGQQAVAHVIHNRMAAGGQDAQSVIFAANQFEPWNNPKTRAGLEAIDPTSKQYQDILNGVVRPVMAGKAADPTGGATHFYSPTAQKALGREAPSWASGQTPVVIGQHNFYKLPYGGGGAALAAPGTPPGQQAGAPPVPGQPVPAGQPGVNPNAPVQIPPPIVPPTQTAGPGAGNAPDQPPVTTPPPLGPLDAPSREAYRAAHPFAPTPEQTRIFSTEVDPRTAAGMAQQEQSAKNLIDQLTQQYKATGDVKILTDIASATDKYNGVVSQNATTRQAQAEKANTAYATALAAHQKALDDSFDKAHELQQTQQGDLVNKRQADDMTSGRKVTDAMDAAGIKAQNMNSQLMQMYPLMDKLPGGLTGAVLQAHPEWLSTIENIRLRFTGNRRRRADHQRPDQLHGDGDEARRAGVDARVRVRCVPCRVAQPAAIAGRAKEGHGVPVEHERPDHQGKPMDAWSFRASGG